MFGKALQACRSWRLDEMLLAQEQKWAVLEY
jgi:hypothetical protein